MSSRPLAIYIAGPRCPDKAAQRQPYASRSPQYPVVRARGRAHLPWLKVRCALGQVCRVILSQSDVSRS